MDMPEKSDRDDRRALGFDVGGTKIEAAVVTGSGAVLRSLRQETPATYAAMRATVLAMLDELRGGEALLGVGFGIPGSLDPKTKLLRNAPNSPAINGTPFFDELTREIGLPVRCENDANCLVLSEGRFGAAKGFENIVGVILGSGVGGGVIWNGKLFSGARGLAPEIGHVVLDVNGRQCLCGNKGCVEAYLSGNSILRRYRDAGGDASVAATPDVFARADRDDIAYRIVIETKTLYSRFIAMLVSLYDPDVVVLGGGLSRQSLFYECGDEIARYAFGTDAAPAVIPARNGDASGKLGAAALFF
jgi:fructokinase